jgi:DNA-binding transcriptional ArsR family regulator
MESRVEDEPAERAGEIAESHYLEGLEQLHALSSKVRRSILERLVDEPMTVTQLGKALGMPPPTVHYHVRELERVGLVRLTTTRERRGILEKYYQAVARTFLLPPYPLQGRSPSEQLATVDELLDDLSRHLKAVLARQSDPVQLGLRVLYLREDDLPEIAQQIEAILEPYREPRDSEQDREHIVLHVAVPTHPRPSEPEE